MTLAEIRKMLDDLFVPNPRIYWADFLLTMALAYTSFIATELFPLFSLAQILLFIVSCFAIYRGALFIHELTHQERKDLPFFSIAFNLFCGVPILVPSFMYRGVHNDHHGRSTYGTDEDGEYIPFGASSAWKILGYLGQSLYIPFALMLRFGILTPLSYLHPKVRKLVLERGSSLAINFEVKRHIPEALELRHLAVLEILCFIWTWFIVYLFYTGIFTMGTLVHMYLAMVFMLTVNAIRTLAAHRYGNRNLAPLDFSQQIADSVNLEGNPLLNGLIAPVGLRYHGLHHIFPKLPYHNLEIAHRRLKMRLPKDSFYFQTIEPSLGHALVKLWKSARQAEKQSGAITEI